MLSNNIESISDKYLLLIMNYNNFFFKNIDLYKNKNFLQNLYIKGITIIQNIFNISLMHLENISDIYNLCEKGYIYFIEFINQINLSNSIENNFELTIKDAIIFCYKKTILLFENKIINNSNIGDNNNKLYKIIFTHIVLINNLFILVNLNLYNNIEIYNNKINDEEILINNIINILNENNKKINKIIKKIIENINFKCLTIENYDVIIYSLKNFTNIIIEINNKILLNNNFDISIFLIILDKYLTKNKLLFNNEKLINNENLQKLIEIISENKEIKNTTKVLNNLLDNIFL